MSTSEGSFAMPKEMKFGAPVLRVSKIDETLRFYQDGMGLKVKAKYQDPVEDLPVYEVAPAASGEPLLKLKHDGSAIKPKNDFAGLYHFAVLVPTRKSLASTFLGIGDAGISYDGSADHYVSEALYLHDAEFNGIEVYADRPRETWKAFFASTGDRAADLRRLRALNKPLDVASLLKELTNDERVDPPRFAEGARIGHVHLRVTDLQRSVRFYHEVLGFDVVTNYPEMGASFLSVGGYHHHIGLNTWNSLGGTPHESGETGLDGLTMYVPGTETLDALQRSIPAASIERVDDGLVTSDPDGIRIELRALKTEKVAT
ncbi:MAG: VOC family protein [Nitrososphaerota archaeon]|nr:VOC family protein [Nitrososphaerota archaeon]